ncbi:MAG: hypothetical protein OEZ25_08300, partial [Candidatus Bathyarchaeota archaeon]|nr:hypothetical protein [Candidatus Bathyarchaeota archaeon]
LEGGARIDKSGDEELEHQCPNGTWVGVDECIYLSAGSDHYYYDDELKQDLDAINYGTLIVMFQACVTESGTCFSGGFIDDLSADNRIIITSSNETSYSWKDQDYHHGDSDGFSEFSEAFIDALYGWNTTMIGTGDRIKEENEVDADFDNNGHVSIWEAWEYAWNHDDARLAVRTENGAVPDPWNEPYKDETPWLDDNGNGLPTYKDGDQLDPTDGNLAAKTYLKRYDLTVRTYVIGGGEFSGVKIWVDGALAGTSPKTVKVAAGSHTVKVQFFLTLGQWPSYEYTFKYWEDGYTYYQRTIDVFEDVLLKAYYKKESSSGGDGPCPTLFVWSGSGYVDYGAIDIHNPTGEDVMREVPIQAEDVGISRYRVMFRLREGWLGLSYSESVIDQVKLYAVDKDGNYRLCPLIKAEHSTLGKVLPQLLLSDDYRVQMLLLETTDLTFIMPYQNVESFTFIIEGCNMIKW